MLSILLFLISAVLLVIKRNNAAGVRCGIASMLSVLVSSWAWYSWQARSDESWYELAFTRPGTIALLAVGLSLTIANAVVYYRKKEEDY